MLLSVRHNIEVAHRLSLLEGKCENIHGHSMWVELFLVGHHLNDAGIICTAKDQPLEFGLVKREFRKHLDTLYDHHLLLNKDDPWAGTMYAPDLPSGEDMPLGKIPGLQTFPGDPSTENIALWIAEWAALAFECDANVKVQETAVNGITMGVTYDLEG
jgi:6-pyruvoyl-tetrahydropterin synthase